MTTNALDGLTPAVFNAQVCRHLLGALRDTVYPLYANEELLAGVDRLDELIAEWEQARARD